MTPVGESDQSAFNFASDYLKQISYSLRMAKMAASTQDSFTWIGWLRAAYRELACKTNPTEDEEFDGEFRKINKKINNPVTRRKERLTILFELDQLEIKIRKKLQEKGMLLPSKNDPAFAVGRR